MNTEDAVTGKRHYHQHASGLECWDIVELMPFNLGNALKYVWRYRLKDSPREDLLKAANYLRREIARSGSGFYGYPVKWYVMMQRVIEVEDDLLVKRVFELVLAAGGRSTRPVDMLREAATLIEATAA